MQEKTMAHGERQKFIGNYEILKTIGEGSFARVKLGIHRLTNQQVALKSIEKEKLPDEYSVKNIHREAQIMALLDHPNIIRLYEVMETRREMCLVLEYAAGGELLDMIVSKGKLPEPEAQEITRQLVSAINYCHQKGVVHRDLKAENVLLDSEGRVKLSDFGLSNVFDKARNLKTFCGSPVYSAPELIEGKKYVGPEVDAWSLGVIIYAMVVGDLPFADSNITALYDSIVKGVYDVPEHVSLECKDLIMHLLSTNPKKRYTVMQAKEHPWVSQGRGTTLLLTTHIPTASSRAHSTSSTPEDSGTYTLNNKSHTNTNTHHNNTGKPSSPPSSSAANPTNTNTTTTTATTAQTIPPTVTAEANPEILPIHKPPPLKDTDLDVSILDEVEAMGFDRVAAMASVCHHKYNAAAATYHILVRQKGQDANKYLIEAEGRRKRRLAEESGGGAGGGGERGGLTAEAAERDRRGTLMMMMMTGSGGNNGRAGGGTNGGGGSKEMSEEVVRTMLEWERGILGGSHNSLRAGDNSPHGSTLHFSKDSSNGGGGGVIAEIRTLRNNNTINNNNNNNNNAGGMKSNTLGKRFRVTNFGVNKDTNVGPLAAGASAGTGAGVTNGQSNGTAAGTAGTEPIEKKELVLIAVPLVTERSTRTITALGQSGDVSVLAHTPRIQQAAPLMMPGLVPLSVVTGGGAGSTIGGGAGGTIGGSNMIMGAGLQTDKSNFDIETALLRQQAGMLKANEDEEFSSGKAENVIAPPSHHVTIPRRRSISVGGALLSTMPAGGGHNSAAAGAGIVSHNNTITNNNTTNNNNNNGGKGTTILEDGPLVDMLLSTTPMSRDKSGTVVGAGRRSIVPPPPSDGSITQPSSNSNHSNQTGHGKGEGLVPPGGVNGNWNGTGGRSRVNSTIAPMGGNSNSSSNNESPHGKEYSSNGNTSIAAIISKDNQKETPQQQQSHLLTTDINTKETSRTSRVGRHRKSNVNDPNESSSNNNNSSNSDKSNVDPSLYLDPSQDLDADGQVMGDLGYTGIRVIKFAFNCSMTTTASASVVKDRLYKILKKEDVIILEHPTHHQSHSASQQHHHDNNSTTATTSQQPIQPTQPIMSYMTECEWGDVKFELEIVKMPRVKQIGLRHKRHSGDMWDYKRLSGKITSELEIAVNVNNVSYI